MADGVQLYRQAYSKLIRGGDPSGPIVTRTEHAVTSRTRDFPAGLRRFAQPSHFFENWGGVNLAVASDWAQHGAFLYQVVRSKDAEAFGLFARLQPRPEGGTSGSGRKFTHAVALAAPLKSWRPGLILAVYDLLFPNPNNPELSKLGEPDVETDREEERMAQDPIDIPVSDLERIEATTDSPEFWRIKQSEDKRFVIRAELDGHQSQRETVADLVRFALKEGKNYPFSILPFGIGLAYGAKGQGSGFALSVYAESGDISSVKAKFFTANDSLVAETPNLETHFHDGKLDWRSALKGKSNRVGGSNEIDESTSLANAPGPSQTEPVGIEHQKVRLRGELGQDTPRSSSNQNRSKPTPANQRKPLVQSDATRPTQEVLKSGRSETVKVKTLRNETPRQAKPLNDAAPTDKVDARRESIAELLALAAQLKSPKYDELQKPSSEYTSCLNVAIDTFLGATPLNSKSRTLLDLNDCMARALTHWGDLKDAIEEASLVETFEILKYLNPSFDVHRYKSADLFWNLLVLLSFNRTSNFLVQSHARYYDLLEIACTSIFKSVPMAQLDIRKNGVEHKLHMDIILVQQEVLQDLRNFAEWIRMHRPVQICYERNKWQQDRAVKIAKKWLDEVFVAKF